MEEDDKNFIKKINDFLFSYINFCNSQANNLIDMYKEYGNNALYYYEIITRNLENIEILLKNISLKLNSLYIKKKKYYFEKFEEIKLKIIQIKKFVKEQNTSNDFDFYESWKISKKAIFNKVKTLNEIKQILKIIFLTL